MNIPRNASPFYQSLRGRVCALKALMAYRGTIDTHRMGKVTSTFLQRRIAIGLCNNQAMSSHQEACLSVSAFFFSFLLSQLNLTHLQRHCMASPPTMSLLILETNQALTSILEQIMVHLIYLLCYRFTNCDH